MAEAEDKTRGSSTSNGYQDRGAQIFRGSSTSNGMDHYRAAPSGKQLPPEDFESFIQTTNEIAYEGDNIFRGAQSTIPDLHLGSQFDEGSHQQYKKERTPPSLPKANNKDLSLMNLTSKMEDPVAFFRTVADAVKSVKNCDVTERDWILLGNDYRQGKHAEFLIAQYQVGEDIKIDFKRMFGSGFTFSELFSDVKNLLKLKDAIVAEKEPELDFKYSDEEDSGDNDEDHLAYGYLHLSYEPTIVKSWLRKIETRHIEDQTHLLGILGHNASNKENLDIIVSQGGKKLRDLFTAKFERTNIAAIAYYTSLLAKHVTGHPGNAQWRDAYDEQFLQAIFCTMKYWLPGKPKLSSSEKNRQSTTKFEVTESKQTIMNLIQVIYNLGEVTEFFTVEEFAAAAKVRLVKPKQKSKKAAARDDVLRFLEKQEETKPVLYLKKILQSITI